VNHALIVLIFSIMLIHSEIAIGTPIINGDFSDSEDLAGFTATGSKIWEPTGDFAQLETDVDLARSLEQTFIIPSILTQFSFDFAFSTTGTLTTEDETFPDSFASSIIADGYFLDIMVVDIRGVVPDASDGIEDTTGAMPIDVVFNPYVTIAGFTPLANSITYSGRISLWLPDDVLGKEATLYFELFSQDDGLQTIAAVDNISATPVPEPGTLMLLATGLVGITGLLLRRNFFGKRK